MTEEQNSTEASQEGTAPVKPAKPIQLPTSTVKKLLLEGASQEGVERVSKDAIVQAQQKAAQYLRELGQKAAVVARADSPPRKTIDVAHLA